MKRRRSSGEQPPSNLSRHSMTSQEVHLRRMRVDDALYELERYLYDAHFAGLPRVRVIHGKGTGTLRAAVWEFLSTHSLAKAYYMAAPHEGDGGVTIVELAD